MQSFTQNGKSGPMGEGVEEISLVELFGMFLRHIKLIVGTAVAGAVIAALITAFLITPMYASEVRLYVNNATKVQSEIISSSDIAASKSLVSTYIAMIKSKTFIDEVLRRTGLDYSKAQVEQMMSASAVDDTEVFYVRIENPDPEVAARIANAFAEVTTEKISEYIEGSSVIIVDKAYAAQKPFSPNVMKNTLIGLLLGAVLAAAVVFVAELLDTRVKTEDQLAEIADYPVIGRIPDLAAAMRHNGKDGYKYGYGGYSYGGYGYGYSYGKSGGQSGAGKAEGQSGAGSTENR